MKTYEEIVIAREGVATSTSTAHVSCEVYTFEDYTVSEQKAPRSYKSIDDLVAEWECADDRKEEMSEARKWLVEAAYKDIPQTLSSLRLEHGWSQAQLANLLNTSQSHVARIERGTENLTIDTCRRLCNVLEIDMNTLDELLRRQEEIAQLKVGQK